MADSASARIRARLDHPVIDCDGHILEMSPVVIDYIRQVGGPSMADRYRKQSWVGQVIYGDTLDMPLAQRADAWIDKTTWWSFTTRTLDRATAMLPRLLAERMDEMGIDFMLPYPTEGLMLIAIPDDDLRQAACRAYNVYCAELLGSYRDRMCPVAVIPMQTPGEAIAALEHAVGLGFKAAVFQQGAGRPIPKVLRELPQAASLVDRTDYFAIDSAYDYDPLWAKCVDLKVAVTFHAVGTGRSFVPRGSISNHLFNRQGPSSSVHRTSCAAMFYGGVSRRFPKLNFAWLEGGVGWASSLLGQLVAHWEKRGGHVIDELDPNKIDKTLLYKLIEQYGDARTLTCLDQVRALYDRESPRPPIVDEFAACEIEKAEDIIGLFTNNFFFGCEGDDPTVPLAYRSEFLPLGAKLKPVYGSDISHWDVPDMSEVLEEAWEAVDEGAMAPEQFRDFVFTNPVRLHAGMNPDFFNGTRVESAVANLLNGSG